MQDTREARLLAVLQKLLDTTTISVKKKDLERHRDELVRNEFEDVSEESEAGTQIEDVAQNPIQEGSAIECTPK